MTIPTLQKSDGIVVASLAIILILAACSNPTGSSSGSSGSGSSDITASYTVSYDGNGAVGGVIPIGPQSYEEGQQITVLENSGTLEKNGRVFIGWNSDPAGDSATWYAVGATLTVTEDVTLYAQWISDSESLFTVSYYPNAAESGDVPDDENFYPQGYTATVRDNSGALRLDAHIFDGWNTSADGTGIQYATGDELVMNANLTLHAQWARVYEVSYDGNLDDGTGVAPLDENSYREGEPVTVLDNSGNLQKDGHTFLRWNTQSDGGDVDYAPGATFTIGSGDVTLYAQWTENPVYILSYDPNGADGGSVPVGPRNYEAGEAVTVSGNTGNLFKADHTFAGWNDEAEGNGAQYKTGDLLVVPEEDVTLYAQWNPPLAQEDDPQQAFSALVDDTILGDPDNGFSEVEGEEGVYVYTKTGGGSLTFWQINAAGTISFEVTLEVGPGGTPTGDVGVYLLDSEGVVTGEAIEEITVDLNVTETVEFQIPAGDFRIDFQGGQRDWRIENFLLTLDS